MMISMVALMHRQWAHHERLVYPLVQLPADMVQEDGGRINPFLKNSTMWIGFSIPMVLLGINALTRYTSGLSGISLSTTVEVLPEVRHLLFSIWFIVIGLTYFLSLEISFSLWFFYLFYYVELALFGRLGYSVPELRLMHTEGSIATAQQAMGAMIALVAVALWTARGHLKTAFRAAFSRRDEEDGNGLLRHRTAVWILLAATAYAVLFLNQAGLPLVVSLFLMGISFVVFFGLTKIVAEGGMGYGRAQMTPTAFTAMAFGNGPIGAQGLTVLGLCNGWAGDIKISLMAAVANGARLAELAGIRGPVLFWSIMLAIAVSLASSAWTIIAIAYEYGGINLHYWFYHIMGDWSFRNVATAISTPVDDWNFFGPRGAFTAAGAAAMLALTYAPAPLPVVALAPDRVSGGRHLHDVLRLVEHVHRLAAQAPDPALRRLPPLPQAEAAVPRHGPRAGDQPRRLDGGRLLHRHDRGRHPLVNRVKRHSCPPNPARRGSSEAAPARADPAAAPGCGRDVS